ncbi:MAG: serine hydrolase, partial [Bacteroidetes bacterium]|nr:serine hydrolase [Bacteroidota bacterium]
MKRFILVVPAILIILHVSAQTVKGPDGGSMTGRAIDQVVKKLMDTADVTGLCIGIVTDNRPVYIQAYGYKNKRTSALNDTATNFYGASLAKPLFAYTVMQLVQEGIIDLDKPLYTYLPKPLPEYDAYK